MLVQLDHLHQHDLVYKYLAPQHIVVTQGVSVLDPAIELHISNIAIMQMLDIAKKNQKYKISGLNNVFFAPELKSGGNATAKADIWSVGVILYMIVVGKLMDYSIKSSELVDKTTETAFRFNEP